MPNTVNRNVSSLPPATRSLMRRPYRSAASRMTDTATSATATLVAVASTVPPTISAATTGRYTAIARSSITSRFSTAGVSRKPRRPKSDNALLTTPDDEIHVTPPSRTAANGSHPRINPRATPGSALSVMSTRPGGIPVLSPSRSSLSEYSSPRANKSRSTPISAVISKKSRDTSSCTAPPSPIARPAIR